MTPMILVVLGVALAWVGARTIRLPLGLEDRLRDRTEGLSVRGDPVISVLIPVRNEAAKIERCIRSVVAQDHAPLEIVVVNDGSTDDTPAILDRLQRELPEARLRILHVERTPPGWTGKNWAMQVGSQELRGAWVLQIDGDVVLAPDALRRALTLAQHENDDLVSLLSTLEVETLAERLFHLPVPLFALLFNNLAAVNDPLSPKMFVNGQFILYRSDRLAGLGGYAVIAGEVADDIAIGRLFQRAGRRVRVLFGQEYVSTRMYETLPAIWRGWSKFLYNGLFLNVPNVALCVARILGIFVVPPAVLAVALIAAVWAPQSLPLALLAGASAAVSVFVYLVWRDLCTSLRGSQAIFLAYPVSALFFICLLVHSSYRIVTRRGVEWKGRIYFSEAGVIK